MAKLVHDEYERSTHQRFAGIHDKRVTNIEMSLGHRMLQIAGLIKDKDDKPFPWAKLQHPHVVSFKESYRMYNEGEDIDHD
jgi:hypothetical protein